MQKRIKNPNSILSLADGNINVAPRLEKVMLFQSLICPTIVYSFLFRIRKLQKHIKVKQRSATEIFNEY